MSVPTNPPPNLFLPKNGQRMFGNKSSRRTKDPDQAVRNTDNDASIARLSAVSKRYIDDEFARFFVPSNEDAMRPPWVNIGTHHRTYLIDALVERFISQVDGPKQVLSLGSGSDSRYWRLKHRWGERWPVEKWIETDFEETVGNKIRTIMSNNELRKICGNQINFSTDNHSENKDDTRPPTELDANDYGLISLDLRRADEFSQKLRIDQPNQLLKSTYPTLILAELVFLYMSPEHTKSCLEKLCSLFGNTLMIITYEALNLDDNFSKMMVQNLSSRGLSLPGFRYNSSVESQIQRFQELGFKEIMSTDMKSLRDSKGTNEEWKRQWDEELAKIKRLEFLDEVEELELILKHYAITWAVKSSQKSIDLKSSFHFYLPQF